MFIRRLGALLAWLDQECRFSENAREEDMALLIDPVHLDAYAESLDGENWRTVTRANGRDFYLGLALRVVAALTAETSPDHVDRVQALVTSWKS
jgi:hypothetical protein